ncbi:MAG: diguanylate cyclase, partial [Lachnospiraceae bacterium]|nr:diguanylate cyclase [Lachnospiraceae bacterium]
VSSDSIMPDTFRAFFRKYGITAGVFLPLSRDRQTQMYVCFVMRHAARKWKVRELTFLNEVKCVIHALLSARMRDNSLAGAYATIDGVLENGAEGLVVCGEDKEEYIYTNEQFARMITDPKDKQNFHEYVDALKENAITDEGYFADVSKRWYHVHSAPLRWMDGRSVRLVTLYDVTETKRYEQKIEEQAKTDYLTGLYNRQQFERDLKIAMKDAYRSGDQGSFLYINLDDFRDVNGEYGHSLGDALLKEAARALTNICKARATCYRIGGDEFGVLVPFYEYTELSRLVGTIQRRFEQSWSLDGREYLCNMSMGVVCFPKDGEDMKTLMQHADIALLAAKENDPGTVEWYSAKSREPDIAHAAFENALRKATEDGCGAFVAEYEPLLKKADGRAADAAPEAASASRKAGADAARAAGNASGGAAAVCLGATAHLKWKTKELLNEDRGEILSAAERLGVIAAVDHRILEDACRHCRYWNDFGEPGYQIYVRLSVQTLLSPKAAARIRSIIDECGINPGNVMLGVKGEAAAREEERLAIVCEEIAKAGVKVLRGQGIADTIDPLLSGEILTGEEFEARYMA